jgi:hypothetical protein
VLMECSSPGKATGLISSLNRTLRMTVISFQ